MKFVLVAMLLTVPMFAQVDRFAGRWAREEARMARQWALQDARLARQEARAAQREALRYRLEARQYAVEARRSVAQARRETLRDSLRYREELKRELHQSFRRDRPDTTGMKRIF